ncbi:hypothetical protein OD350_09060 [Clostridium beijerinckii]|uniref:Uncharacterized protein n=1 Tax=Clostridium beijerinckii TaxID=1520 RepID=A0AAX0AY32_CLOBE|nr:hypothetical protein [Clostridium beijerinckii]MBA8934745.1 hypothetical protein [Clostridium beijerinckii]NOW04202.1 hypothetical protein [Clostridium beijerinckii]NRT35151.1 hypothetical protein [Clostridium beijerinckii]NRT45420.1 hypothetical protein [Clostridium beijerinckii]NRT71826.1 hypothetical protein [Clostridium beijerinckii]
MITAQQLAAPPVEVAENQNLPNGEIVKVRELPNEYSNYIHYIIVNYTAAIYNVVISNYSISIGIVNNM